MLDYMVLSLNTTLPFILLALLGIFLKRKNMINDSFITLGNKVVFYVAIPTTIFRSIHRADLSEVLDTRFLIFNSVWLVLFFLATWVLAYKFMKDKDSVSSFVNSAYRSSLSVVAPPLFALMFSPLHHPGIDPNIYAKGILSVSVLLILSYATASVLFAVHDTNAKNTSSIALGIIKSIVKNPVVIGVVLGLVFNVLMNTLDFELPVFATNTINSLAGLVMPLAMICVGGNLTFHGVDRKFKYVIISTVVKLFIMPIAASIVAYLFGFRGNDLTIIMILNALPMAVGAYVMQAELGGDSYIGASVLMITMTLSAFTLTMFIFIFRVLGFLV
ncbi:MAG: AEC family transporter [Defluviitaleaceae bacterium]|nr:AEC family transporter [Defluviitaleaceae bacterium]MCL2262463.1 AEC family transporter [Defluviitaleaceae bacterium]